MSIKQSVKDVFKHVLPPPTVSLMREINNLKRHLYAVEKENKKILSELNSTRRENKKTLNELKHIRKENARVLNELNSIREDHKRELAELSGISTELRGANRNWDNYSPRHLDQNYVYLSSIPEERYPEELCKWYYQKTGEVLNLAAPKTFNEKIQWLKLYDSTPLKTRLADKYLVRDWVKEKIGEEYLVPLLGVWDSFDEIDFDRLPDRFELKTNHGSGWNLFVEDKAQLDLEETKKKFDEWLRTNYAFRCGLELHYLNIPPKIIAEQRLDNIDDDLEYNIFCAGGKPRFLRIEIDRYNNHRRAVYSMDWKRMPVRIGWKVPEDPQDLPKPKCFQEMVRAAEIMCKEFALVRIDFYVVGGKPYFGEMTFTTSSGTCPFLPREFEYEAGSWITLPPKSPIPKRQF